MSFIGRSSLKSLPNSIERWCVRLENVGAVGLDGACRLQASPSRRAASALFTQKGDDVALGNWQGLVMGDV